MKILSPREQEGQLPPAGNPRWLKVFVGFCIALVVISLVSPSPVFNQINLSAPSVQCLYEHESPDVPHLSRDVRNRLVESAPIQQLGPAVLFVRGADQGTNGYTNTEVPFVQESMFKYLTQVPYPECAVMIDTESNEQTLLVPERDDYYAIWNGRVRTLEEWGALYDFARVNYTTHLEDELLRFPGHTIYTLPGQHVPAVPNPVNDESLIGILRNQRVVKSADELELLRISSYVSAGSHKTIMEQIQVGWWEYNAESMFMFHTYNCALRFQSYIPIVGYGENAAILHYNDNNRKMDGDKFLLIDAAGKYRGYTSDITRTYPVDGSYSPRQRQIYNTVLRAQEDAAAACAPGVAWSVPSDIARLRIAEGLLESGLAHGATPQQLVDRGIVALFYMHSLGHSVGLDVHDPGSWQASMPQHMVFTIEPGLYFNRVLLEPALDDPAYAPFLDAALVMSYLDEELGGVRIEDVYILMETEAECISCNAPKTVAEIEATMAGNGLW